LADLPRPAVSRDEYAAQYRLDPAKSWITLMPGSRVKEVRMNLPGILAAARLLGNGYEFILPVAPTLRGSFVEHMIKNCPSLDDADAHVGVGALTRPATKDAYGGEHGSPARTGASGPTRTLGVHLVPEALPGLAHSRTGIIASGTATVEAALMEIPFVMVYRVTRLTYFLGRSTVKVPHFAMANLIAGREIVPELVQQDFTAERVAAEINRIIPDGRDRETMVAGLREVRSRLRGNSGDGIHPADMAAQAILSLTRTPVQVPV
jgi:lipid-A-disaccharide synthase